MNSKVQFRGIRFLLQEALHKLNSNLIANTNS